LFLGRWLDSRYNSKPWFFLGLTAFAFAVSTFGIIKETMIYYKKLEEDIKKEKLEAEKKL